MAHQSHSMIASQRGGSALTFAERIRAVADTLREIADDLELDARVDGRQLSSFDWSVRVRNALSAAGITTLGQLVRCTNPELKAIPNLGYKSVREIEEALAEVGLLLQK